MSTQKESSNVIPLDLVRSLKESGYKIIWKSGQIKMIVKINANNKVT